MGAGVLAGQQQTLPLAGAEGWSKIFASSGTGMTTRTREGTRHRFGAFVVDVRASELLKSGKKIKVQLQPMQVLAALLEQPGEIVTRDELRKRIWPEDTFVDFEHSLNTAVKKLRQALGDRASKSKYIETLPRRGYRFLAEVEASENRAGVCSNVKHFGPLMRTAGRGRKEIAL